MISVYTIKQHFIEICIRKCGGCRYWLDESYEERHAQGQEPHSIDKEFLRLWFREHCDPYRDEVSPMLQCGKSSTLCNWGPCVISPEAYDMMPQYGMASSRLECSMHWQRKQLHAQWIKHAADQAGAR